MNLERLIVLVAVLAFLVGTILYLGNYQRFRAAVVQAEAAPPKAPAPPSYAFPATSETMAANGLTKREFYAALIMQGFAAHGSVYSVSTIPTYVERAFIAADAMIAAEGP